MGRHLACQHRHRIGRVPRRVVLARDRRHRVAQRLARGRVLVGRGRQLGDPRREVAVLGRRASNGPMIENRRFAQRRVTDGSRLLPWVMPFSTLVGSAPGCDYQALRGLLGLSKNLLIRPSAPTSPSAAPLQARPRAAGSPSPDRESPPAVSRRVRPQPPAMHHPPPAVPERREPRLPPPDRAPRW